jgi:hypothetical protein
MCAKVTDKNIGEQKHNDRLKNVVNCECVHVFEGKADFADFTEMGVDIVLGVAVPCHESSDLASKKDSLHVLMLEREICEKGFPYLFSTQKMGRAVFVNHGEDVGELRPQRYKTAIYCVFKKVAFIFVHSHP